MRPLGSGWVWFDSARRIDAGRAVVLAFRADDWWVFCGGGLLTPRAGTEAESEEGLQMHNKSEQATAWGVILFALAPLGC